MPEPWKLRPDERERGLAVGYTDEQMDAYEGVRKANWQAIKADVQGEMSDAEFAVYYKQRYDIDHICTCAEDRFNGHKTAVPDCLLRFHNEIVDKLEEVLPERDELRAAVDDLRMQVAELGDTPRR